MCVVLLQPLDKRSILAVGRVTGPVPSELGLLTALTDFCVQTALFAPPEGQNCGVWPFGLLSKFQAITPGCHGRSASGRVDRRPACGIRMINALLNSTVCTRRSIRRLVCRDCALMHSMAANTSQRGHLPQPAQRFLA